MPLTAKYTWEESVNDVTIRIPLKGTQASDVGIFCADVFVRVSFRPYVLVLDLLHEVDEALSNALSERGVLTLRLPKAEPSIWGQLCVKGLSKAELKERRKASEVRIYLIFCCYVVF